MNRKLLKPILVWFMILLAFSAQSFSEDVPNDPINRVEKGESVEDLTHHTHESKDTLISIKGEKPTATQHIGDDTKTEVVEEQPDVDLIEEITVQPTSDTSEVVSNEKLSEVDRIPRNEDTLIETENENPEATQLSDNSDQGSDEPQETSKPEDYVSQENVVNEGSQTEEKAEGDMVETPSNEELHEVDLSSILTEDNSENTEDDQNTATSDDNVDSSPADEQAHQESENSDQDDTSKQSASDQAPLDTKEIKEGTKVQEVIDLKSLFSEDDGTVSGFIAQTLQKQKSQARDRIGKIEIQPISESESSENPVSTTKDEKKESPAVKLYEKGMRLINSTNSITSIMRGYQHLQEASTLGSEDAQVEIAFAHLFGLHRPMNIKLATEEIKKHAGQGHSKAQAILGFMHATGIGVTGSQGAALLHWTFSAMSKDTMGQQMMAYRYWAGYGVKKNCERALPYYRNVAYKVASGVTMNGGLVIVKVRLQDEEDNPGETQGLLDVDLIQYYQFLADKGDTSAQLMLGQLHYQGGRGVERDHSRAFDYFKRAADTGNGNAQAYIGKIYAEGTDNVKRDDKKAFEYFQMAAEQGNSIGYAGLGLFYKQGRAVAKNYDLALENLKLSSDQGWPEGQLHLGSMYFNGEGVKRDYKQAFQLYSVAAQNGHLLALFYLAEMHAEGVGVSRSCNTAAELYKNVCERGHHAMLFEQAHAQYKALRVDSAYAIYTLLSELGHEVAQSNAAFMLDRGIVSDTFLNSTDARALQLWTRSATQGYINARIKLGDYHYYGRGTPVDYEAAAEHYKTAGDLHKSAQAYFNLGYMHEKGLGFKRDIYLAKRHYDLASEISSEASAPVTIALAKITFLFAWEALSEQAWWNTLSSFGSFSFPYRVDEAVSWLMMTLTNYWDIYLITMLLLFAASIYTFNRRRQERLHPHQD